MAELTVTLTIELRWWVKPLLSAAARGIWLAAWCGIRPCAPARLADALAGFIARHGMTCRAA